jgi:hypothetical protein
MASDLDYLEADAHTHNSPIAGAFRDAFGAAPEVVSIGHPITPRQMLTVPLYSSSVMTYSHEEALLGLRSIHTGGLKKGCGLLAAVAS